MIKIYIDSDYKCHASNPNDAYMEVEAPEALNGKCAAFIEGCRYVPHGNVWMREDGHVFEGEMLSAWKDIRELERAQAEYEHELLLQAQAELADADAALAILGVTVDE